MREKVIEDLVAGFPTEFFTEPLVLLHRQLRIGGRILDLLFEDERGGLLLIEIKAGGLVRQDVGQATEYFGLLKKAFAGRELRIGLLATSVSSVLRSGLEAIGLELFIVGLPDLQRVAAKHGVDPLVGIPRERGAPERRDTVGRERRFVDESDRKAVTNEQEYFELIETLADEHVKDKLATIYGAVKKTAGTQIRFKQRGRAVLSVDTAVGTVDLAYVGVDFKGNADNPPRGTLTLLWKNMAKAYSRDELMPFAALVDGLLGRSKAAGFLDLAQPEGTYDTLQLEKVLLAGDAFARFLSGLEKHVALLAGEATTNELVHVGSELHET